MKKLCMVFALCAAANPNHANEVTSVGRDGASDAVSFIRVGVPAVEFGPVGGRNFVHGYTSSLALIK